MTTTATSSPAQLTTQADALTALVDLGITQGLQPLKWRLDPTGAIRWAVTTAAAAWAEVRIP